MALIHEIKKKGKTLLTGCGKARPMVPAVDYGYAWLTRQLGKQLMVDILLSAKYFFFFFQLVLVPGSQFLDSKQTMKCCRPHACILLKGNKIQLKNWNYVYKTCATVQYLFFLFNLGH